MIDKCLDKEAILDTIPYSRVFYHAFPGAVIMHRGQSYIVCNMNHPPSSFVVVGNYRGDLCAFLKTDRLKKLVIILEL